MTYIFMLTAIALEVLGTSFLQQSRQFTRLAPSLVCVACYLAAFYLLSLSLRHIPVGVAYAMWSGLGIVLISAVGYFWFKQSLDLPALIGIALIICGVVVINAFSSTSMH